MNNFKKFAVVGSGSWGSAIAAHLARMHELVVIYSDSKEVADEINNKKTNSRYLESVTLPPNLVATDNIAEVTNSEVIFIVVPSHAFGNVLEEMKKHSVPLTTIFVIATKGISSNPLELLSERFRRHFANPFAFFSGPNFAKEVALGKFSSATVSSPDLGLANSLAQKLSTPSFEISTTESINPWWQSDYAEVEFTLATDNRQPLKQPVYLMGDFTGNQLSDSSLMEFDERKMVYYKRLILKQGFYSYQYVVKEGSNQHPVASYDLTEGNYWETENNYTILVYYRPFGGRHDELVGLRQISSIQPNLRL